MKIDLHVHSKHSKRPSIWLMQKIGCPESFTEPADVYEIARRRGMTHVAITDHNVIDGALEIADRPGVVIGEELTTYFVEDRCKVHVLVWAIDEVLHRELQEVRENLFDLVPYLQERGIHHAVAHPLSAVNDRLTAEHFEQLLLLFKVFELNADQDHLGNRTLRRVLDSLTPAEIERLADKHGIVPAFDEPWKKGHLSGSDDHSSLNIGTSYTEVAGAETLDDFFAEVVADRAYTSVRPANPQTVGRNVYSIAYQFFKDKFALDRYTGSDLLLRYLDRSLLNEGCRDYGLLERITFAWNSRRSRLYASRVDASVANLLRQEACKLIYEDPRLMAIVQDDEAARENGERTWFAFVNQISSKALSHFFTNIFDRVGNAQLFDIFHSIGSAGALYALLAPYFVAFSMFSAERKLARQIGQAFLDRNSAAGGHEDTTRVAHFTDTFADVNGVARTMQQNLDAAARTGRDLTVVTCSDRPTGRADVRNFLPVGQYALEEYPEQKLAFPPLLEVLNVCYEKGFTHIHTATPGPVGLAGLAAARILDLPLVGTYHTALPQYASVLTGDLAMEELMWKYILWFYNQMDVVWACSRASVEELIDKGLPEEKVRIFPRGVATGRFRPDRAGDLLGTRFGVPDATRILYVGRVSREKNLPLLVDAFRRLVRDGTEAHLVVVGDGPYLEEMRTALRDTPATFTGYLEGDDLPAVYAESDLFVFPSATDTFGNVVLEAQACGLPVIVSDRGGPKENLVPDVTGRVVPANERDALVAAIRDLLADQPERERMQRAARRYAEDRSFDKAFEETWAEMYEGRTPAKRTSTSLVPDERLFAAAMQAATGPATPDSPTDHVLAALGRQ